jgi:predicted acylesterase/phospholipase RssA
MAYAADREVRFAVVLYGGVSLAIYMNGIVQELFSLVRASAPAADGNTLHLADDQLRGAEPVYRDLARRLGAQAGTPTAPGTEGPVKCRIVVDILTGTSAGGINGVFLAKALANDQSIERLARLWVDNGDIAELLNDSTAYAELGGLPRERPPESLLSGTYMLFHLLDALGGVSATNPRPAPSPYADQIDLWVSSTDLSGRPEEIGLSDQPPLEPEREVNHRARFHFVYDAGGDGEPINMFSREYDPLLAFVARATSSFPGAFRPVQLRDVEAVAANLRPAYRADEAAAPWLALDSPQAQRLFQRYGAPEYYESVSFADGGYLDNKPVDLVMETLPKRRADLPVSRRVLVVDPNPGGAGAAHTTPNAPRSDLLSTLLKVVTLPRAQTIGGEIDRIKALSGPLETRERIYAAVEGALTGAGGPVDSPARQGYLALRAGDTIADLAAALARIGFSERAYEVDSAEYELVRAVVTAWRDGATISQADFLRRLDLAYFLRRVNYVNHRGDVPRRERGKMADIRQRLIRAGRTLRSRDTNTVGVSELRAALDALEQAGAAVVDPTQPQFAAAVHAVDAVMQAFAQVLDLDGATNAVATIVNGLGTEPAKRWTGFDEVDEATLALRQLIPGENKDIAVVRVSPRDATSVCDEGHGKVKLAGTAIHHFGGFFRPDWRRNDIMWGRLDAAERLIGMLVDDAADARIDAPALIRSAHEAIITDLLADANYRSLFDVIAPGSMTGNLTGAADDPNAAARVLDCLRAEYQAPPGPTREDTLALASRSARVVDGMTAGLADDAGQPLHQARSWLSAFLRPAAQLGDLVLDRSIKAAVTRHLLDLAVLAGLLMIVVGSLFGGRPVVTFGWTVFAVALGIRVLVNLAANWVRNGKWWWVGIAITAAVFVLVGVEGLLLASGTKRWLGLFLLGLACGLVVAIITKQGSSAIAIVLAALVLVSCAFLGITELATHPVTKLCNQSGWEHDAIDALPALACPPG